MAKKILIVDDETDLLKVLSFRLEKSGYDVSIAANGQEALDLAYRIIPDLIILDVYLPVINGDEVAKRLRSDGRLKHIPIILISATTESLKERAKECQANSFFSKPFEPKDLIEKIEKLI